MFASHPQAHEDHRQQGAKSLVAEEGIVGDAEAEVLRRLQADEGENLLLEPRKEMEDPDPRGDVGVDEVGKPEHGEAQCEL